MRLHSDQSITRHNPQQALSIHCAVTVTALQAVCSPCGTQSRSFCEQCQVTQRLESNLVTNKHIETHSFIRIPPHSFLHSHSLIQSHSFSRAFIHIIYIYYSYLARHIAQTLRKFQWKFGPPKHGNFHLFASKKLSLIRGIRDNSCPPIFPYSYSPR